MTITFNRAHLIKVAETALAEHTKAEKAYAALVEHWKAERAARHVADYHDALKLLRDQLTIALRTRSALTRVAARHLAGVGDIEYMFYVEPNDYDIKNGVKAPQGRLTPAELIETRALIKVLKAAVGDTVSANELKLLGLKNLQPVFAAASTDVGKAVS
jgi:hypothetical protein